MTDLFNDFINAAASDCVNARIRPEPIEAPEVARRWDLRDHRAAVRAWQRVAGPGKPPISFETVTLAIQTYLDAQSGGVK
jgi:hypothetical protein